MSELGVFPIFLENDLLKVDKILGLTFFKAKKDFEGFKMAFFHLLWASFVLNGLLTSSETQGQSVGSAERARRKFSSTGERAPGYRLSPNYFQKFKRMPAPDWAQKMLCIIVPNRRTVSPEFFS